MNSDESYASLMEILGYPDSVRFRAVLENLMTPDQARMAAALPGTAGDVAEKTGFDAEDVQKELDSLFIRGVTFPKGDYKHREYFNFARGMGRLHDSSQATKARDVVKDREFYQLWHDFVMNEWYPDQGKLFSTLPNPFQRIVPAYKAVKDLPGLLPQDDFHEILKAQEKIAVVPCSCRHRTTSVGEHCEYTAEEDRWNCLQFGRAADYVESRDSGKLLTIEEALELCDQIEDDGLLHMWGNTSNMVGTHTSCQCCMDCCMIAIPLEMAGASIGKAWEKSRFQAVVDQDKCIGCQDCIERCQFDAIEMVKPEPSKNEKKSKKMKARIIPENCWGCGVCVVSCDKTNALSMIEVRPSEHIPAPVPKS